MPGTARVLVIDDSPTIRRVVGSVLQRAGHDVATADDGHRGVAEVAAFAPDLVLLDMTMPNLDGLGVLHQLAAELGDAGPPVILMSTRDDALQGVDQRLRSLGVVDVITKPFSPEALLAVVHHSLEKHRGRARTSEATRVVVAMASIVPADSDTDGRPLRDFGEEERTMPATPPAATTEAGAPVQSTQHAGPPLSESSTALGVPLVLVTNNAPIALPGSYALVGDLSCIALPEVLQLLKFQTHTGLLVIDAGGVRFDLGLVGGDVVSLIARNPDGGPAHHGEMRLGRYFVAGGVIAEADLEAHVARIPSDDRPLGERLVAAGVVTRAELRRAIADQAQDFMVELLRSRRGTFGLRIGEVHVPTSAVRPGWSVDGLLFEALRRIDEWGVIESEVPSFEARFALRGAYDDAGLSAEESALMRGLRSGPARVRDLVKRSPLRPFDVCRVVYRLAVLKRIHRIDDGDPRRLLSDDRPPAEPVLSTLPHPADQ